MLKLAIDFGTSVTKIFKIGSGIVLSEATCVTVTRDTREIRAFGNEAKRLLGKTADATEVCFPVYEGEIVDERLAAALLEFFLSKVSRRGVEALFCVPCGFSPDSRAAFLRVAKSAGVARAEFVETPYLAVLGHDAPLSESNPVFAIDMGAGKTSLAAFSLDGIIAGLTMNVGGSNMDIHIIDHIAENYRLKIGSATSEKLKNSVGSLIESDNQSCIINGRDVETGRPRSVAVSSGDVLLPIRVYVDKVIEYAEIVLRKLPAEVSAAMCKNGIFLAGGVTQIAGFSDYVSERLQMEAHLPSDPQMAVVLGGGRAMGNPALLAKLKME